MKKFLFSLLILCGFAAKGQHYYNEWIDYSKTYYKFKLAKTGLYRIPQSTLTTAGLGTDAAENFQLWRNGEQVPLYTSVASGPLAPSDYIEFWGEMNDGRPDKELYKRPEYQLNDKWSLETDSATYFLTVNSAGANMRLAETPNNTAGTTLSPEPYFMYTAGTYYRNQINPGYAINVGEYLYSSSYDNGEGWTSGNIDSVGLLTTTLNNLYVYPSGPDAFFKFNAFGKAIQTRRVGVRINSTVIDTTLHMDFFDAARKTYPVPVSLILSNKAIIQFDNIAEIKNDRMVVAKHELIYPRLFNFGGAANFEFSMPEKGTESYLEISGFSYGATPPILYDLTNGKRYAGDITAAPFVRFVIAPSATERRLVLVKYDAANTTTVNSIQERKFLNYTDAANSSNYIIITNSALLNSTDGTNPVEEYRAYRSSAIGGGFDAKIYREDELADQFGYGIKKNPIAIRNFLLYYRNHFSPKHVFIIGKGVNYTGQYTNQNNADIDKLNLVPTFGWPASDALLTANPGTSIPQLSYGRLSAINTHEVSVYLKKIKEYEQVQVNLSPNRQDREWMKNVVHLNGIDEPELKRKIDLYYDKYKSIITDTLFGGKVTTFTKSSTNTVEQISSTYLNQLFKEGISLMTYFGHSSSNTLAYNLDDPDVYDNKGKYPLFIALGCNVGDFFNFNTKRLIADETLSEKYVLAEDRGTIGFIASTHFGIVHYLDVWNTQAYKALAATDYGASIGEIMVKAAKSVFEVENSENFYAIANVEETELHGDPALRINAHAKPDYVIDESLVKTTPDFISVAEPFFKVTCKFVNIGKAVNKTIVAEIKREYPDKSTEIVYRDTLTGLHYADSLSFNLPIDAIRDKGVNKIIVSIDADNEVDELYEINNSITKEVIIFEDELKPVYPNNFAIVNKQNIKFIASTANVFSEAKQYNFELDTTEQFNSTLKITRSVTGSGGIIEFEPATSFTDSTVYYWRVGQVPPSGSIQWNKAAFIYLQGHDIGFDQSHLYQQFKIMPERLRLDSASGVWNFTPVDKDIFVQNGVYPTTSDQGQFYKVELDNGSTTLGAGCNFNEIIFNVVDPVSFKAWKNDYSGTTGLYKSLRAVCGSGRGFNFQFMLNTAAERKKAMDFIDLIPAGSFVVVRSNTSATVSANTYASAWKSDTLANGSGNSLYHKLFNQGFSDLDSFYKPRSWSFVFKKDGQNDFTPESVLSEGLYDRITLNKVASTIGTSGTMLSPVFGPAKRWKRFSWSGRSADTGTGDDANVDILGVKIGGGTDTLFKELKPGLQDFDISSVNAAMYPYLQLKMRNTDTVFFTPYQLRYWRLTYEPVPEGALAPNIYVNIKDTLEAGEPLNIQLAFKNISETNFDSLKVKMVITDASNVTHILPVQKQKPLNANDTLHINYVLDTKLFPGLNKIYLEANPDNDQPEQYHFNNYAFKNFYVATDSLNPLLDVTFDAVHILNNDIISSKPHILIKLKDEAEWALLDDTSLLKVQVRFPDKTVRTYNFNSDTLQFIPAQKGAAEGNTATINFNPYFEQDGDDYELIVSANDKMGNKAGNNAYRVGFEVINKAMISNLLNYPNPFTSATAFVFTITGSEVPQEFKIQILTVTGKVVREITKQELGPLHIGRNITDFKWDGTDQYGQKLGNGVYLYRVVTSLNGKTLEKYKSRNDNTDQYFNKGYGKMYLMR